MLESVEWDSFTLSQIFNRIEQGRRLKKDDQILGKIPFVMAGVTNTGVVNYISNPVASFPANSITVDIFGNAFYRSYAFGAGDDTGVYWNDEIEYSPRAMIFLTSVISKSLLGKYSYGSKLRSSQSFDFKIRLPVKNGNLHLDFMENFVAELETQRTAELEAYLSAAGLKDYTLTTEEVRALEALENREITFIEYKVVDLFTVKNTNNILSRDVTPNSGNTPYLSASRENNAVSSYISHRENLIDKGNCIFIGGKTFVVTYQAEDFYSNDSHNLCLYLKEKEEASKLNQLCIISCIERNLGHKYSWGDSISNKKIQTDTVFLPSKNGKPDYAYMQTLISAVQKQVIKDVVYYADEKIAATKTVTAR